MVKAAVLNNKNEYPKIQEFDLEESGSRVKVKLLASALNHRDLWIIKGKYPGIKYPIILGSDGCGVFEGNEVLINPGWNWGGNENFQAADFTVLGLPEHGTFSSHIVLPQKYIHKKPAHLTATQAAALPLAGVTAYRALLKRAKAQKGDRVLITGIGGGVALFALQFAIAMGLDTYVTSGSNEKIQNAIKLGAKDGVNYKEENWSKELSKKANGNFDVIVDSAGGPGFRNLVALTNPGARIVLYGGTRGNYQDISPQHIFWRQVSIIGSTMGSEQDFQEMLSFVEENKIIPIIDSQFKLDQIDKAFELMDQSQQFGKIVIENI